MKTKALLCLFLLCAAGVMAAQTPYEYSLFMENAGNQSILFRGHQAVSYSNIKYNGHYYWETPTYRKGTVMLDGKRYDDVLLNIDASDRQLLTCAVQGSPAVALNRDDVEWFEIDGNRYVNLCREGKYENAEIGFYMVVMDGTSPVFLRIDKNLRSGTEDFNGKDGIGYDDPNYRKEILSAFIMQKKYYAVKAGRLKRIAENKVKKLING